jgi:hypothetical protein
MPLNMFSPDLDDALWDFGGTAYMRPSTFISGLTLWIRARVRNNQIFKYKSSSLVDILLVVAFHMSFIQDSSLQLCIH